MFIGLILKNTCLSIRERIAFWQTKSLLLCFTDGVVDVGFIHTTYFTCNMVEILTQLHTLLYNFTANFKTNKTERLWKITERKAPHLTM